MIFWNRPVGCFSGIRFLSTRAPPQAALRTTVLLSQAFPNPPCPLAPRREQGVISPSGPVCDLGKDDVGFFRRSRNDIVTSSKEVAVLSSSTFIRSVFSALLGCLLTINVGTVFAAEKVFGLPEVLSYALENNGEIKALRAEGGLREAGRIRAGLLPNPSLEFEGAGEFVFANEGERRFSAAYSQEILTAGNRATRLKVAGKDLEEDVKLARVEGARSKGRKAEAEREIEPSRLKLFSLMGLSTGPEIGIAGTLENKEFPARIGATKNEGGVPSTSGLASSIHLSGSVGEIHLAEAQGKPNVTAVLSLERVDSSLDVGDITAKDRDKLVGLKLSVPLP